jgi:hypothetical protein
MRNLDISINVEYVYLTSEERQKFADSSFENLIENIECNNVDIIEDIQINETIYLDIKTIFIINKYICNDDTIYI